MSELDDHRMSELIEEPRSVALEAGQRQQVTLPSLSMAGYRWTAAGYDTEIVRVDPILTRSGEAPMVPGKSLDERFAIVALAPGETTVHFAQARSFEPGKPPRATHDVTVRVQAGG